MIYICPSCGRKKEDGLGCVACGNSRDDIKRITDYSNGFYNQGLKKALNNEITNAIINLRKSLLWNKYNIQSHNLLGLMYYRIGNIGEALKEWIISSSLDEHDEKSRNYIRQIQNNPKKLEGYRESIRLYNNSLEYLENKNIDVAIIRLKKTIHINPQLTEARVLLGLCYIKEKKYKKAKEHLIKVISIDSSNTSALKYLHIINDEISNDEKSYERIKEKEKEKIDKSLNKSRPVKTFRNSMMYFLIGVAVMLPIQKFLIQPTQTEAYDNQINILTSQKEEETRKMEGIKEEYISKVAELEKNVATLEKQNSDNEKLITTYKLQNQLEVAKKQIEESEYVLAASTIYGIDKLMLDENSKLQYEEIKDKCYKKAADKLCSEGIGYYNNKDYANAKICFEKVIVYDKDSWIVRKSMYYLAEIEFSSDNIDQANNYYKKVIENFPGTEEARIAAGKIKQ